MKSDLQSEIRALTERAERAERERDRIEAEWQDHAHRAVRRAEAAEAALSRARELAEKLASLHEAKEREFRSFYERCRDGDVIAQETARVAREREKMHRDFAHAARALRAALAAPERAKEEP